MPKTFQNEAQKLSKSALGGLLEASWGLLGLSWGHLGKTSKKIIFWDLNLGAKMEPKIRRAACSARRVRAYRHFCCINILL